MLHVEVDVTSNQARPLLTNHCLIKERSHSSILLSFKTGLDFRSESVFYKPFKSTLEGHTHFRTENRLLIKHQWWFSSRPALISSLFSYSGSPLTSPFKHTMETYPCCSTDLCTPTHPSCSLDGPWPHLRGTPSSHSASQNTHFMQQGIRMQTSSLPI